VARDLQVYDADLTLYGTFHPKFSCGGGCSGYTLADQ
jgi:hypothetical protein